MRVIVISLEIPQSARKNFECTWEHLGVLVKSPRVLMTSLEAPRCAGDKPEIADDKAGSAGDLSGSISMLWGCLLWGCLLWGCLI